MKSESEIKYQLTPKTKEKKIQRPFKPIVDQKKCTLCKLCVFYCPRSAVSLDQKKIKIDYNECDGCLICLRECEPGAIKEERE